MNLMKLWNDEAGAVTTIELLLYGTIAGLGVIVGMSALRNAINSELTELANAISALNQGYSYSGQNGCNSSTAGSAANDVAELQDLLNNPAPAPSEISVVPCGE